MEPQVSAREFERWMRHLDGRFDKVETAHAETAKVAEVLSDRVTALESNQEQAGKLSARLSAVVSTVVTAVVAGILYFLGGR